MIFQSSAKKFERKLIASGKYHHVHKINKSQDIIDKIISIYNPEKDNYLSAISYLQKIDPYIFEELILSVLERKKIKITRNTSYSGDGGIDGIFKIKQGSVLIQCKRYTNYISHNDVTRLTNSVKTGRYFIGLFVHTGSTGKSSIIVNDYHKLVVFLCQRDLILFIVGTLNISQFISQEMLKTKGRPKPDKKSLPSYKRQPVKNKNSTITKIVLVLTIIALLLALVVILLHETKGISYQQIPDLLKAYIINLPLIFKQLQ